MDFKNPEIMAWYESRPPQVRQAFLDYPPDRLYRHMRSGFLGIILAYSEHVCLGETDCPKSGEVSVKLAIASRFNPMIEVESIRFGVELDELEDAGPIPQEI